MQVEYRFLQANEAGLRFAKVQVRAEPAEEWSVHNERPPQELTSLFDESLRLGVAAAIAEQGRRSSTRFRVAIVDLILNHADTTEDAVECAAAIAAWRSFGHAEDDVAVRFVRGRWVCVFEQASQRT